MARPARRRHALQPRRPGPQPHRQQQQPQPDYATGQPRKPVRLQEPVPPTHRRHGQALNPVHHLVNDMSPTVSRCCRLPKDTEPRDNERIRVKHRPDADPPRPPRGRQQLLGGALQTLAVPDGGGRRAPARSTCAMGSWPWSPPGLVGPPAAGLCRPNRSPKGCEDQAVSPQRRRRQHTPCCQPEPRIILLAAKSQQAARAARRDP